MFVIIGGGISGLSAAYELSTRRVPFVLLEASERVGGLVRTEHVAGYTIDAGADSMLATKPAGIRLCEEIGLGPRLMASTPPRTSYVHARGRLYPLPSPSVFGIPTTSSGIARYGLLPASARLRLREKLAASSSPVSGARSRRDTPAEDRGDESVADFYRREFGPATVGLVAQPLLGGIHAGDVEQLSMGAVAPRLVAAAREGRLFEPPAPAVAAGDGLFRALRGGMGELVEAIEARVPAGSIRTRTGAQHVSFGGGTWRVASDHEAFDARAVIVAAPAHVAARILAATDPGLSAICAEVEYVSTVSVALAWPRVNVRHPLRGSGFVVARAHSRLRISACTWVSSKWDDRAPAGMVLLRAFLGGVADPDVAELPDAALAEIATTDLATVLRVSGAPHLTRVQRWTRAGAQHQVGHAARLARIEARLTGWPGLFLTGSGFRAIGVPDCVADGRAVGAQAATYVGRLGLEST